MSGRSGRGWTCPRAPGGFSRGALAAPGVPLATGCPLAVTWHLAAAARAYSLLSGPWRRSARTGGTQRGVSPRHGSHHHEPPPWVSPAPCPSRRQRGCWRGEQPCPEPPAHRSVSGRPGASPPGCSGCKPPGKTRHAPGSGRRCSCLRGENEVSGRCHQTHHGPRVQAGGPAQPQNARFLPKGGRLPSLIRVMASSFLPLLFPLSSSSNPGPAGDKTHQQRPGRGQPWFPTVASSIRCRR